MRFRTAITLTILAALTVALLATVAVVSIVLDRAARRVLDAELTRDRAAFADMLRYRKSLHRSESRVLADEPRLKAVVSTDDVTTATVQGVVSDLRRALRCDLLLITDRSGRLLADALHPDAAGESMADLPLIVAALAAGDAEDVWVDGTEVFQVHARRLSFGALIVGTVVVGYRMDDALADSVGRHLGAGVLLLHDREAIAASRFEGDVAVDKTQLASVWAVPLPQDGDGSSTRDVQVGGVHYLMTAAALPDYQGKQSLHYALFRSLDRATAPARSLVRILYGVTALTLLLALLAAFWLSRRLSRPIDELVAFAHRIAAGDLSPASITGLQEVRTLSTAMVEMVAEIAAARIHIAEKTRLAKEMEIAERIQMSILPRSVAVKGLSSTALMVPASEVGGDFYDVVPCAQGGCWIGIGDVAGHGLPAGLVMLMLQSAFAALVRALPTATPRQIVVALNQILFDNVRNRLGSDEHVTFTAARYFPDGRMVFAGAHESMVVWRHHGASCELVDTPGTWLGVIDNVEPATVDTTLQLAVGDVMVLYTDGVTEAMNEQHRQFGLERLCEVLQHNAARPVAEIHAQIMDAVRTWSKAQVDDITLLVLRREDQHEH